MASGLALSGFDEIFRWLRMCFRLRMCLQMCHGLLISLSSAVGEPTGEPDALLESVRRHIGVFIDANRIPPARVP